MKLKLTPQPRLTLQPKPMQSKGFKHIGKIISIQHTDDDSRGIIYVSVDPIAACEGCKAKSQCLSMNSVAKELNGAEGSQSKIIKVESTNSSLFEIDDTVNVCVTYRIGVIAVIVAYIIPLFVFISMLATLISGFGVEQGVAALATFAALGIYYSVVYALRQYFEKVVVFDIEKII